MNQKIDTIRERRRRREVLAVLRDKAAQPGQIVSCEPEKMLRDEFACAALSGICAHPVGPQRQAGETSPQAHARWALCVADAMMKARGAAALRYPPDHHPV